MSDVTSPALFRPKGDDGVPEWRKLHDLFKDAPYGTVFTYERLDEALGRDFRANRGPLDQANKKLEELGNLRTVTNVRGVGYRVIEPREHVDEAAKHEARIKEQGKKMGIRLRSTNKAALTPEQRQAHANKMAHLARVQEAMKRTQDRTEEWESFTRKTPTADPAEKTEASNMRDEMERLKQMVEGMVKREGEDE